MIGVIAVDQNFGIGMNDGSIPWKIPEDMKHFKKLTTDGVVVMGRKTWESIPDKFKPLTKRDNIILTRQNNYSLDGFEPSENHFLRTDECIEDVIARERSESSDIPYYIIGGREIYEAFASELTEWHVTYIHDSFNCEIRMYDDFLIGFSFAEAHQMSNNSTLMHFYRSDIFRRMPKNGPLKRPLENT